MKQELLRYKDVVNSTQLLSKQVVPLKDRRREIKEPKEAVAVCDYKQSTVRSLLFNDCFLKQVPISLVLEMFLFDTFLL